MELEDDGNPLMFVGAFFYWTLLLFSGLVLPGSYVVMWTEHAGLVERGSLHVGPEVWPWLLGIVFMLAALTACGFSRLVRPLATVLVMSFAYALLLPAVLATGLILLLNAVGLTSDRMEGCIHLGLVAGWWSYGLYISFAPERKPAPAPLGDVARPVEGGSHAVRPNAAQAVPVAPGAADLSLASRIVPDFGQREECDTSSWDSGPDCDSGDDSGGDSD